MYSRKLALTLAKRYRTCPPAEVRRDPSARQELMEHLARCPYCTGSSESVQDSWEELMEDLKAITAEPIPKPGLGGLPRPGGLCLVRSDLAGWYNGLYYNPPLVLVLDGSSVPVDHVLVAQAYHDACLAGPGDLILPEEHCPIGELFIECWNTYTLELQNLDVPLAFVSPQIVDSIGALRKDPMAYPRWAMHPRPMEAQDARLYFRKLEVDVGFFFSSQAVGILMEQLDLRVRLDYASVSELMDAITDVAPGTEWPVPAPESFEAALTLARFPVEQLRLAAAEADQETLTARLVTVKDGKIISFKPVAARIVTKAVQDDRLKISGHLPSLPRAEGSRQLLCLWVESEAKTRLPESVTWDEDSGHFAVTFFSPKPTGGNLELVCLCDITEA